MSRQVVARQAEPRQSLSSPCPWNPQADCVKERLEIWATPRGPGPASQRRPEEPRRAQVRSGHGLTGDQNARRRGLRIVRNRRPLPPAADRGLRRNAQPAGGPLSPDHHASGWRAKDALWSAVRAGAPDGSGRAWALLERRRSRAGPRPSPRIAPPAESSRARRRPAPSTGGPPAADERPALVSRPPREPYLGGLHTLHGP